MANRRRIEERIKRKEAEIQALETQIKDARTYIQALQDVLKMFPREEADSLDPSSVLRPGSLVAQARDVLIEVGRPLHVDDILQRIGKDITRSNKTGLSGSIAAYVRRREIFTRPAPNTFGLIELQETQGNHTKVSSHEPPPDFGIGPTNQDDDDEIPF
jgi:hypothetical protein